MPFPEYTPLADTLTSMDEISKEFSELGVDLHTDDFEDYTPDLTPEYEQQLVQRATRRVLSYLGSRWDVTALSQDLRIREIATYIACKLLSERRGNPSLFSGQVSEGIEELERIREGTLYLDVPSNGPRATIQSGIVDNRAYINQYRIFPKRHGTSHVYDDQRTVRVFPFSWL